MLYMYYNNIFSIHIILVTSTAFTKPFSPSHANMNTGTKT